MIKRTIFSLTLACIVSSCTANNGAVNPNKPNEKTITVSQAEIESVNKSGIVEANNKFGFKLFEEISKKEKNIFISPASISMALTMTYNGSDGETKEAMAKTLELKDLNLDEINKSNNILKKQLTGTDPDIKLSIANSLWADKGTQLKPDFIKNNEDNYDAKLSELDFNSPEALTTINGWVNDNTEGKIPKIIKKIEPGTFLYLINAIYFKGSWTDKFDKAKTVEKPFTLEDGNKKNVQMMAKSGEFSYYKEDNFQAVNLPYGKGNTSMYLFLPENDKDDSFYKSLNSENWDKWISSFSKKRGALELPRFKIEYENKLNDTLKNLGMTVAFSSGANFKKMVDGTAYISEVMHKTFAEVNEEGTEAAAATSVAISKSAILPGESFKMAVEHPFFCAITDKKTGEIIFMGTISEPK